MESGESGVEAKILWGKFETMLRMVKRRRDASILRHSFVPYLRAVWSLPNYLAEDMAELRGTTSLEVPESQLPSMTWSKPSDWDR